MRTSNYPYNSKKVILTQGEGDVVIDRDLDASKYEVMAINAAEGSILFGVPKLEQQILALSKLFGKFSITRTYQTHEHVQVVANDLLLQAAANVDVHGTIQSQNLAINAGGSVKLTADKHNFGKEIKQSVIRSDNMHVIADNIEIIGSLIKVKNNLKIVSHNDIKIIPIELINSYYNCSGKTTTRAHAVKQVVSEINAGMLNIDAGRTLEFVAALVEAESINIHAKDLKISSAREIFERQVEFQCADKWYGKKGSSSCDFNRSETVIPTVIHANTQRILVDQEATLEAAQIFADEDILFKVGGNLSIKDGYNLHIHDYQSKKYSLLSFNDGKMKINSNKTVKDFFKDNDSIPTIICAGNVFYGIADGQMHILGSKIIGKNIHVVAPNGLKLEASKYLDTSINFIHQSGLRLGYYAKGNKEAGIVAGGYIENERGSIYRQHLGQSELLASDTLNILVHNGTFEQISSNIAGKLIQVSALNWVAKTYSEEIVSEHVKQRLEAGVKLAAKQNITQVVDKIKLLVAKKGSHIVDKADTLFKSYDAYKSLASLPENATSGGLYAYLEGEELTQMQSASIAVDNVITGEVITARVNNDIRFQGVKMSAQDVDIEACNFQWQTSSDNYEYQYQLGSINLEIDLLNEGANSNLHASVRNIESSRTIHHENYIKASGNLKLTLSGTGKFIGCSLEGANVEIKADNLVLAAVQDTVKERLSGANFHVGYNQSQRATQFGGGIESGFKKAGWSNQLGRIIGSNVVNIVVKESLELAGGIIANSEQDKYGNISDKGNLSINCGRMIVKTIHDYDQGVTLGIGASFQVNQNQEGGNNVSFSHVPLKVEYGNKVREVFSVVGEGKITSKIIEGNNLQRTIAKQVEITEDEKFSFDSVIHKEMFVGSANKQEVSIKKTYRQAVGEGTAREKIGNYLNDLGSNLKNAGKDLILGGAKFFNLIGGSINQEQLDDRLHDLIGKDKYTGIEHKEQERFLKKIKQGLDSIAAQRVEAGEGEDVSGAEDQQERILKEAEYEHIVHQLKEKIGGIEDKKARSFLQAAAQIFTMQYLKEVKLAKEEGRAIKDAGELITDIISARLTDPAFTDANKYLLEALIKTRQLINLIHKPDNKEAPDFRSF